MMSLTMVRVRRGKGRRGERGDAEVEMRQRGEL